MEILSRIFGTNKKHSKKYQSEIEEKLMSLPIAASDKRWPGKPLSLEVVLAKYKGFQQSSSFHPSLQQDERGNLLLGQKAVWEENLWTGEHQEVMRSVKVQRVAHNLFLISDESK